MLVLKEKPSIKAYLYHHLHCKQFILLFIHICTSFFPYIVLSLCDYVYTYLFSLFIAGVVLACIYVCYVV